MITSNDAVIDGITRRRFGKLAAVGVIAAALPHHASGKLDVGIGTYSYHALTVDDMIDQLRALNIAEIEMSRGEFMLMNHPGEELFRSVRAKLDRSGILRLLLQCDHQRRSRSRECASFREDSGSAKYQWRCHREHSDPH